MWFCTKFPNFIRIGWSATALWRHIDFPRWRPYRCKFIYVFRYGYVTRVWRYKAIRIPNFDHISQSMADILVLPVSKSKLSPYWNPTSSFHIKNTVKPSWACDSALAYQIMSKLDDRRRSYDVISILQHGGYFRFLAWPCVTLNI